MNGQQREHWRKWILQVRGQGQAMADKLGKSKQAEWWRGYLGALSDVETMLVSVEKLAEKQTN